MSSLVERLIGSFVVNVLNDDFKGKIVIELAVGFGTWGHLIRSRVDQGAEEAYIVGCDINRPYLEHTRKYSPYDELVVCDITHLPFREGIANLLIACEVIEHLPKETGKQVLRQLPKFADKVFVSMPCGYLEQGICRGNRFEAHQSGWVVSDLKRLGYRAEKTGLGVDLEKIMKQLHLYDIYHMFQIWLFKDKWGGAVLMGVYEEKRKN